MECSTTSTSDSTTKANPPQCTVTVAESSNKSDSVAVTDIDDQQTSSAQELPVKMCIDTYY